MAQSNWHFRSHRGASYYIGLYHSPQSGNVVIYCNSKVTTIDFGVLETKCYSFFIGEELLEVQIEKKDKGYNYSLNINSEVATPLNKRRKKKEAEDKKMMRYAFIGLVVLMIIVLIIVQLLKD